MKKGFRVLDSDLHTMEPDDLWPQYLDASRRVLQLFNVTVYPTFIVLDRDGIVRARRSGYGSDTDGWLEREIKKTLEPR